MHPYANDSNRTRMVILVLAVASILLAWGLGAVFQKLDFQPPWWLDTPAVIGFYGMLWTLYNSYLWRLGSRNRNLSGILNVSGDWDGEIHSSFAGGTKVKAELRVRQTATRLIVVLRTESSSSRSSMAMVRSDESGKGDLLYDYLNEPRALSPSTMGVHWGQVKLSLNTNPDQLIGDYSTNASRGNEGRMVFKLKRS